jgi:hypothetical protein
VNNEDRKALNEINNKMINGIFNYICSKCMEIKQNNLTLILREDNEAVPEPWVEEDEEEPEAELVINEHENEGEETGDASTLQDNGVLERQTEHDITNTERRENSDVPKTI